jgi:vacuolar-type H+-ATPase subunit F/Vma7
VSKIVALGAWLELAGYGLVGVDVVDAPDPEAVRCSWVDLAAGDVAVVLLTPQARRSIPDPLLAAGPLWAVLPE